MAIEGNEVGWKTGEGREGKNNQIEKRSETT